MAAEWQEWQHKQDESIIYEVAEVPDGYLVRKPDGEDNRYFWFAATWEELYEPRPDQNDAEGTDESGAGEG